MKMERLVSASAAVALALGLAASANAHITTVTYTGTVINGNDQTGVFGAGANLAGAGYTAVYTVDDSVSDYSIHTPTLVQLLGGSHYHNQSPVSAAITINNVTLSISGGYFGHAWQSTLAYGHTEIYRGAEDYTDDGVIKYDNFMENRIISVSNPIIASPDINAPLSYTVQKGDSGSGYFSDLLYSYGAGAYSVDVTANLHPTSVTIAQVMGVPEPATWMVLLLGVGMIGFAARRRNEGAAITA